MKLRFAACAALMAAALAVPAAAQAATTNYSLLGLGGASAGKSGAAASPATIAGLLGLSTSTATANGAGTDLVNVAGISLYGKANNGGADQYTGLLAAAGPTIDAVNSALCPGGVSGPACLVVLGADGGQASCAAASAPAGVKYTCTQGQILGASANGQQQVIGIGRSAAAAGAGGSDCGGSGANAHLIGVKNGEDTTTVDGVSATNPGCGQPQP